MFKGEYSVRNVQIEPRQHQPHPAESRRADMRTSTGLSNERPRGGQGETSADQRARTATLVLPTTIGMGLEPKKLSGESCSKVTKARRCAGSKPGSTAGRCTNTAKVCGDGRARLDGEHRIDFAAEGMDDDARVLRRAEAAPDRAREDTAFRRLALLEREAGVVERVGIGVRGRIPNHDPCARRVEVRPEVEGVSGQARRGGNDKQGEHDDGNAADRGSAPGT